MTTTEAVARTAGTAPEISRTHTLRQVLQVQSFQILLVLMVIFLVFSALAPEVFPTWGNVRQIIQNVSILGVLGIGMTFVIVTSGIDLSIGSNLVFSGVVAAKVMQAMGGSGWGTAIVGIFVAVGCGLGWGLLNGVLIAKAKVPPLIVTLGTLGGALGLAQVITGGVDIREVPAVLQDTIGYGNVPGTTLPTISLIAIVLILVFGTVLHRTRFGLYIFAVGSNEESARRVGVKVDRQLISIYVLSGGLAGVAGILSLSQYGTTAIAGQSATNLNVIAAVVIGGTITLRRRRHHLRNRHRPLHPRSTPKRLRHRRHSAVLAAGGGRRRPRRRSLCRSAPSGGGSPRAVRQG